MSKEKHVLHHNAIDLSGRTFDRLKVIEPVGSRKRRNGSLVLWLCDCSCGKKGVVVDSNNLTSGGTRSCGCLRIELITKRSTKHGEAKQGAHSPEHDVHANMIGRCFNKKNTAYKNYGGRGITICQRWRNSLEYFIEDAGRRPTPSHTIDRVNNDGHYSCGKCEECLANGWPMNVRWAGLDTQSVNKRSSVHVTWRGITKPARDWAKEVGISHSVLLKRLRTGWDVDTAMTLYVHRTSDEVTAIRALYAFGVTTKYLSGHFRMSKHAIYDILKGRRRNKAA